MSRGAAYLAAGLFALSTGLPWVALHANTEAYMLLPLVTSLVAFTVGLRTGKLRWFLLCGLLGGLAVMTKQVAMWNVLALAVAALSWRWSAERGLFGHRPPLAILVGAAAGVGLVTLPFAITGSLGDLFYANFSYNWLYVGALTMGERLLNVGYGVLLFFAVAAPLIAAGVVGLATAWKRRTSPAYLALALWAVGSAVGVATGGRFFPHYFLHLLPGLALLAAIVLFEAWRRRHVINVGKPVLAMAAALSIIALGTNAVLYLVPRRAEQVVAESVYVQRKWAEESKVLGMYIQQHTAPRDSIFNLGREPQLYFYADRQPPGRFFYDWAIAYDQRNLDQLLADLRHERPKLIIDSALEPLFADYRESHPAELMAFVDEHYEYEGRVYFADVYTLKPD